MAITHAPEAPIHYDSSPDTDEWTTEKVKNTSLTRRLLKYLFASAFIGVVGLAGTGAFLNSRTYERMNYTQEDWKKIRFRVGWVKLGHVDPCITALDLKSELHLRPKNWKCEDDLVGLDVEDIPTEEKERLNSEERIEPGIKVRDLRRGKIKSEEA